MPAALRTRLRPPSHPTRYCGPQRSAVGHLDVDAGLVLREAGHVAARGRRSPAARRPTRPGCARSRSATARARRGAGWGCRRCPTGSRRSRSPASTWPAERNRSAIPRWSISSIVRAWRPPARWPTSSWSGRRSTTATSTPARASSPASISPVGPPPAITTACSVTRMSLLHVRGSWSRAGDYGRRGRGFMKPPVRCIMWMWRRRVSAFFVPGPRPESGMIAAMDVEELLAEGRAALAAADWARALGVLRAGRGASGRAEGAQRGGPVSRVGTRTRSRSASAPSPRTGTPATWSRRPSARAGWGSATPPTTVTSRSRAAGWRARRPSSRASTSARPTAG